MTHIAIDVSRLAVTNRTGTEHYTYELLGALARQDRRSQYTLYCNQRLVRLPPLGPNFGLRRIPFPRLWTHARLSAEVLAQPPDVLFIPAHVLPLGAPLRRNMHTVVTVHDLGYMHFPSSHTRAQRLYLRLSTLWSARVATQIIAISNATCHDLIRFTGISSDKVTTIHHGVSAQFHATEDVATTAVRQKYGIDGDYFLYLGTIQPRKNILRLIDAFASIKAGIRPLRLVIAGKPGWLTQSIEQRATERGVADRVHFIGYVADADRTPLLRGAIGFVFPSLYEGFGMPILEAMQCGTPVITSTTSALPEVAGDAAILVNPGYTNAIAAAMIQLASNTQLREDLRRRGFARVRHFTWDRCAEQTLQTLQKPTPDVRYVK
ncbi:MAG: glycosyltransferase family 1 protein [Chloroflexota bacterium]